jgi:hypothetical protein
MSICWRGYKKNIPSRHRHEIIPNITIFLFQILRDFLLGNIEAREVVAEAAANSPDVAGVVLLAGVLGILSAVWGAVVGAGKDTIDTVLVEDIGIEEDTWSASKGTVLGVVGSLGIARGSAEAWVIWNIDTKGLGSEVAVLNGWSRSVDRGRSERDWAIEAIDARGSGDLESSGTGIDNLELALELVDVGGFNSSEGSTVESALDQGSRGRVSGGRADGGVWDLGGGADNERNTLVV